MEYADGIRLRIERGLAIAHIVGKVLSRRRIELQITGLENSDIR